MRHHRPPTDHHRPRAASRRPRARRAWMLLPVPGLVLGLVLATAVATDADAQDLRYTTVSEAELGGALGRMIGAMPGVNDPLRETTWISGARTRTDADQSSSIVDFEAGRLINLDHANRTYWEFDLAEFTRSMAEMAESMREGMEQAEAEARHERAERGSDEAVRRLEVDLSTERTGDRRDISGFETERVFVTLEMKAESLAVAEDEEHPEMEEGTMVLLTELWLTEENLIAPPEELDVSGWREATGGSMEDWAAMEQVFMNDPDLQVAFDRSRAALDDLQGTALESTLFWVIVPPDKDFDLQKVLDDRDRGLADDVADAAAESAKESAKNAVRGRLGGLLGGGDDEEEEEEELVQQTFFRVKTRIEEVDRSAIPPSTFEIPEGYTKVELPAAGPGEPGSG